MSFVFRASAIAAGSPGAPPGELSGPLTGALPSGTGTLPSHFYSRWRRQQELDSESDSIESIYKTLSAPHVRLITLSTQPQHFLLQ